MAAAHLENLLFLLLIVAAALFNLLAKKAGEAAKKSQQPEPDSGGDLPGRPIEPDQERIRKFLEALGQPPASRPPPKVAKRPTYRKPLVLPRVPPFASPLPPLTTRPPELPSEIQSPALAPSPGPKRPTQPVLTETTFEIQQTAAAPRSITAAPATTAQPQVGEPGQPINIVALLSSASGLREAIILREILGPPRGLQTSDLP